jgi:hypothetical protein
MLSPERCSTSSRSKSPPSPQLAVDGNLLLHEELRVVSALGGSDFHDEAVPHGDVLADRARMVEPGVETGVASGVSYPA